MGHVVKQHSRKQAVLAYASKAIRKDTASQNNEVGDLAASVIEGFTEQLLSAQFSEHEESEADEYGIQFLQERGIPEQSAVAALNKLAERANTQHTFLSSHPEPQKRAAVMEQTYHRF